jgi:hypothetical protein
VYIYTDTEFESSPKSLRETGTKNVWRTIQNEKEIARGRLFTRRRSDIKQQRWRIISNVFTDADGEESRLDQASPASGLRVLAESAMLPAAACNTALTGETIRRSTNTRTSRGYRITKVSLSQRLVARDQAHWLHWTSGDECIVYSVILCRTFSLFTYL